MRPSHPRRRPWAAAFSAAMLAGAALGPGPSAAEGALAVGLPDDVAEEGFAYGYALNKSDAEEARAQALGDCKTESPGVDKRAQALCAVVRSFHNQCFAVAMDPQDATPGVGWAIADDAQAASRDALAKCVNTAGDDRRDACKISQAECDGTAK